MAKPARNVPPCEKCGKRPTYRTRTGRHLCHRCGKEEALEIIRRIEGGGK